MQIRAIWAALLLAVIVCPSCGEKPREKRAIVSLSYSGHRRDADIDCFISAYPEAAGSRLDDCVLCHTEGEIPDGRGKTRVVNACDYCHYLTREGEGLAASFNPFGTAYAEAGRNRAAFGRIRQQDSDGDGYSNLEEIRGGFFPGRSTSNPGKPAAPQVEVTVSELESMPSHRQFMMLNSHKQQRDSYATYRGVRVSDLLTAQGVDLDTIGGITVFAPDGFAKSYSREEVIREYPAATFHSGLDDAGLGEGKGIVDYPEQTPDQELPDGAAIPGRQFLLLAYERDGKPLDSSILDPSDNKILGEGPYRIVRSQSTPSRPDRGSRYPLGDDHDYDEGLDHNAGDSVRGVTVIRVDPMPEDFEEFDARNASWRFLQQKKLVIYGHGIR